MKSGLAFAFMLASVGSAMAADAYDAIYVSDAAVCEQAAAADMNAVLFDLQASAVAPRRALWVRGEMSCNIFDQKTHVSPIADSDADVEIFATGRCYGAYTDFTDQLLLTTISQNINLDNGDTGQVPPDKLEVMSMRADLGGEEQRATDGYAGIYTKCDALTAADFGWTK